MGSEFDQQNEAKIIMSKENMELNKQVEQLGGALKKKSREVAQMQRRADLQVAGEKMERARVQAIVIADKKREQKSNKRNRSPTRGRWKLDWPIAGGVSGPTPS